MVKKFLITLALAALMLAGSSDASAQFVSSQSASGQISTTKEERDLYLNTIGTFSAGFVLQSYGYIGVLADALSKGVYSPDLVRSMLSDTLTYLRNIRGYLEKYQTSGLVAPSDLKFINSITVIIDQLIAEAQALSSFAQTKNADDLKKFEDARKKAWQNIEKTFFTK